ncbi:hypothetical protein B0H15DRAFT_799782 [Mycena belliarum]|uniref:Uncharacterized protein n=1 Tax=Mycena belliarum TaxID=1033014 RepID=A0AAD6XSG3_9AGAR|nr:hypothetical protein B0H15DRAFT_799782 [Mycena belliae]
MSHKPLFRWSNRTFGNKHKAFEKARQLAADYHWNHTEPSGPHEQHFTEYMHWLGIVAMFKPDGWCWMDTPPDTSSGNINEKCAAELSQNFLFHHLKDIAPFITKTLRSSTVGQTA